MKKIKLGIINSSPFKSSYGGIGPFMKNLDPFLNEAFEVTYINMPYHIHNISLIPRRLTYSVYLLLNLRKLNKYNILLSHVTEGSYIISSNNVPFIHIFHGNHNPMSQSRFWYGKYFKEVFDYFEKRILKTAKLVYTVGNERENIPKILNPVFHSVTIKPKELRSGFIFAGRLEKIKNIDKIIKIYSLLDCEIITKHSLYIAGYGSQELYLKKLVVNLNLSNNVIFTGDLSNEELIKLVSKRSILLMASSQEGLPMAIAESLSVGIPVISTNTGDIGRAIKDNYNGFLLPVEFDLKIFAEKIKKILDDYDFFSSNALRSSEIFKAENVAKSLIKDINKLVQIS